MIWLVDAISTTPTIFRWVADWEFIMISICPGCNNTFNPESKWGLKKFCKRSCAHIGRSQTAVSKKKISDALIGRKSSKKGLPGKKWAKPATEYKCKGCANIFRSKSVRKKFCEKDCRAAFYIRQRTEFENYKIRCKFNFSIKDYPDLFNGGMIEQFGWYNPKSNINGISRDHSISVRFGFDNNIDPSIISHPANCKLMRHLDNQKKNTKSSITLAELLEKIMNVRVTE